MATPTKWFTACISAILHYRWWWIAALTMASVFGAYLTATQLAINNSVSIWFLEDNPDYQDYLQFQHERGSDEIIIAMVEVAESLDTMEQKRLRQLHEVVDTLPGVRATFSLANARYPIYANRQLYYRPVYPPGRTPLQVERLLTELPAIAHQLVGPEGKHLLFYVQLAPTDQLEATRNTIVSRIAEAIAAEWPKARISGQPILNEAFNASIYRESTFFAAATVAVIVVLLFFFLPHWWYIPIALAGVAVPISIIMGVMMSLGYSLNLISMLIPTILMVYSVSDGVHVINIFHQEAQDAASAPRAVLISRALYHSLTPCFYTTLTTVIGYLALCLSPLPAFRVMGVFTFAGMLLAFFIIYLVTAIGFSLLPRIPVPSKARSHTRQASLISRLVTLINHWTSHRPRLILGIASALALVGFWSLTRLEVNTDSLHLLGEGKAKSDLYRIEEVLGGNARFQLNIAHRQDSSMLRAATLDSLAAFQAFVEAHPRLATPVSVVNFRNFLEARSTPLAVFNPVNAAVLLGESARDTTAFFSVVAPDQTALSISVNVKELETKQLEELLSDIRTAFAQRFSPEHYELTVQGFLALFAQLNQFILQTQFRSFGLAFLLAFGILIYFVGDWKTSILVLLPNLLPLLLTATIMALAGIALEAANAMLAPIMLGVAMDDTIHLLHRYRYHRRLGMPVNAALDQALHYTGGALLATTIALVCGFVVVGLSGVVSVQTFGLLCAFTVATALLADVVVLPALLKWAAKSRGAR